MGTRSITKVWNNKQDEKPLMALYSQYDGYLSGHGKDLKHFLESFVIGNGLGGGDHNEFYANGMGCLAAQLVAHFKTEPGSYYICGLDDTEEYNYNVYVNGSGKLDLVVTNFQDETIYTGSMREFDPEAEEE